MEQPQDFTPHEIVVTPSPFGGQLELVEKSFASLFENSEMKKQLASLRKKYSKIEINSLEDTKLYELVKKGISEVRPLRTATEKKTKELTAEARVFVDKVRNMGADIQAEIAKIEDPLWKEREKYEALQKQKIEDEAKEKAIRKNSRLAKLTNNGCGFNGQWWSINDITIGIQMIEEMTDDSFEDLLQKVIVQNTINQEKEAEQLRLQEEEKQKQAKIKEENDKFAAQLKAQQEELDRKVKEIDAAKEKMKAEQEKLEADKLEAERKAQQAELDRIESENNKIISEYAKQFEDIGFKYDYSDKVWRLKIDGTLISITKQEMLDKSVIYDPIKTQVTELRLVEDEKARLQEEERKAAEQQKLTEAMRFSNYIAELKAITLPELTDAELLAKVNAIQNLLNK